MTGPYTQLTAEQITAKLRGIRDARPIGDARERRAAWDRCWVENSSPSYFNVGNENEHEQFRALRTRVAMQYLWGVEEVVEFGCGAGDNLLGVATVKKLRGYDWSESAVARCRAKGIEAEQFDMFEPHAVPLEGCGVLTVHAMEQLGVNHGRMLNLLLAARPAVVVHIEPIYELYDPLDLNDFLAMKYHDARGYLKGYLPCLELYADLIEVTKSAFGNINHRAYSVVAWRPKP